MTTDRRDPVTRQIAFFDPNDPVDLGPHPRWPKDMDPDVRRVIADEVDVTMSGFPSQAWKRLESAITAYAEQLGGFSPLDIRHGFRDARRQAGEFAPSPSTVHDCVASVANARRKAEQRAQEEAPLPGPLSPAEIPDWRSILKAEEEKQQAATMHQPPAPKPSPDELNPVPPGVTRCAYHDDCDVANKAAQRDGRTIEHLRQETQ